MKKLYSYLISEFFLSFFLGLSVFTFMFLIFQIMDLLDLIISKGVPAQEVLFLFIYIIPSFLAITIPMAVLTAVLMTFGKLAQQNEITALKSAGISLLKIANPILIIAIILSFAMVSFNDKILPWGNKNFRDLYFKIVYERVQVAMKEGVFITSFPGYIIYIDHLIPKTSKFEDIKIIKLKGTKSENAIFAKKGELVSDKKNIEVRLKLYDGIIHQISEKDVLRYYRIKFQHYWINLAFNNNLSQKVSSSTSTSEMSINELEKKITKSSDRDKNILLVELHKKISIPFACLTFTLIGIPLGVMIRRSGKSVGFGISLILIIIYYAILITGIGLGERGRITPWLAIWAPNFILSLVGLYLLIMAKNDASIFGKR